MAELQFPEASRFRLRVAVLPGDIDELNHVSNLAYVRWVQEAATAHSAARGWPFSAYQALGAAFMVRRHELDYLGQVRADDDIAVDTWVASWKLASSVRRTTIIRLRDERPMLEAATTWALVRIADGRPTKIPSELRDAFVGGLPLRKG